MKLGNKFFILFFFSFCPHNILGSSQEPSLEAVASAELDSNEIKPINERKILQPPSPAYNKNDIEKIETGLKNEYDNSTWTYSDIERRMEEPTLTEQEEAAYQRSMVDDWAMRRALRNEQRKNAIKNQIIDQKHEALALRNADKFNEITQYAKSVDGKVDTLHADHEATRRLAKATRGGVSAMKLALGKHKANTDERLKRHSGEMKENGTRLATIEETMNGQHQQTEANMDTIVKQIGKNLIQQNEVRTKIGNVLEQHGKHMDKTRNKLNKMKARTKHLYDSVEVQANALDKLGTHYGSVNDEMKVLKEIIAGQSVALAKLQLHDRETLKQVDMQQLLTKNVLESDKQLLQVLADLGHKLDAKSHDAIDNVNVQLAKVESMMNNEHHHQQNGQENDDPSENMSAGRQPNAVSSFAAQLKHPLFLKKRDPRREQYEREHQAATAAKAALKPGNEPLGRPYVDEFKNIDSSAASSSGTTSATTDESNISFASAFKALGLKKNGNKLEAVDAAGTTANE